jgi:hypothetical protein
MESGSDAESVSDRDINLAVGNQRIGDGLSKIDGPSLLERRYQIFRRNSACVGFIYLKITRLLGSILGSTRGREDNREQCQEWES